MLQQGGFFSPTLWKDPDYRCIYAISKVDAWGLLLFDMLVDVGIDGYVFMYEFFEAFGHLSINTKVNLHKKNIK